MNSRDYRETVWDSERERKREKERKWRESWKKILCIEEWLSCLIIHLSTCTLFIV